MNKRNIEAVREYWNAHTLGKQYVNDGTIPLGTSEYFEHIRPWMNPWKFPDVMPRIDREARRLKGKHLLEIGCGMGFDSAEFMKRGVRVTSVDLTPNAVKLAKRHFQIRALRPEEVRVGNALDLDFPDESFDAVYSIGVLHATGDLQRAVDEVYRVLKPGGRAIVSHIYRKGSFFRFLGRVGRENLEFKDRDPPVNDFFNEREVRHIFRRFEDVELQIDHYRALPVARRGLKGWLYMKVFRPAYNLLPENVAKRFAHKISVVAVKPARAAVRVEDNARRRIGTH
jgi:ubiquinone/menaquinone biosynthesis C-methylase UbiE